MGRTPCLFTALEHTGIAGFDAQCRTVSRHIGACLINDRNDAKRYGNLLQMNAAFQRSFFQHPV